MNFENIKVISVVGINFLKTHKVGIINLDNKQHAIIKTVVMGCVEQYTSTVNGEQYR
jgi:hypothetical protein